MLITPDEIEFSIDDWDPDDRPILLTQSMSQRVTFVDFRLNPEAYAILTGREIPVCYREVDSQGWN